MTSQLNVALIRKLAWLIFFDMLSMGICTARQWQTSDRLVQEVNVCTVIRFQLYTSNHVYHTALLSAVEGDTSC